MYFERDWKSELNSRKNEIKIDQHQHGCELVLLYFCDLSSMDVNWFYCTFATFPAPDIIRMVLHLLS